MPRTKEQNEHIRQEKRAKILQEATVLFAAHGLSQTTIAMVAKSANISFGSVFTYFPTKEELFQAVVLEPLDELKTTLFERTVPADTPLLEIKKLVKQQVRIFSERKDYLRIVQYVLGQSDRFPDLFVKLDEFLNSIIASLEPLIIAGQASDELEPIDPKLVALSYFSYLNGIRLTINDCPDNTIWDMYVDQGVRLFGPKR
ncbi:TetR/AcrR family transcriptional regulator [Brevibacillus sp. SYSU BS000544]|uniref:TetR/AcrR family transcriptional regulator n=1 Tax=Brevibacillus sp. SYSU BS000544 TaxID=3416443 RepID=UPI003CE4D844